MGDDKKMSDTLPRRGLVNEVCREWLVHEDEALAYRLQKQEVEEHLSSNRTRNAQVREDFPKAKEEQQKEMEEATRRYQKMLRKQAEMDSYYARHIAEKSGSRNARDRIIHTLEHCPNESASKCSAIKSSNNPLQVDVTEIGTLLTNSKKEQFVSEIEHRANVAEQFKKLRIQKCDEKCAEGVIRDRSYDCPTHFPLCYDPCNESVPSLVPDAGVLEDGITRRMQEERDANLARMLQEEEEELADESLVDRDRMLAIEAQDKELAKLIYQKEKAKLKRAKERAKQKALLKKQEQRQREEDDAGPSDACVSRQTSDNPHSFSRTLLDTEAEYNPFAAQDKKTASAHTEIAPLDIDSAYRSSNQNAIPYNAITPISLIQGSDRAAPPYMPIQGQRRLNIPAEKKLKKKSTEGCRQQ